MKISKIIFLFLLFGFSTFNSYSQANISFAESSYDFGKVAEGTQAMHEFSFKNTGDSPLIIDKVQASCGCTTPYWTKEPILPGKSGVITASYNSANRPGAFNKSITITSNATVPTSNITIKGTVVPVKEVEVVYSQEDLEKSPRLSFDKDMINLGKVELEQTVPFAVSITNNGKTNLIISQLNSDCKCIQFTAGAIKVINPGKTEEIELLYRALKMGKKSETASILSNDLKNPDNKLSIQAEVVESLSNNSILKESNPGFTF